ncbi:MAG: sigma-54 dependent transcriptional regulator [Planctomycetes bacterium]|nr:sigma-54 dependent transcriptional regulator [Planctomycetota bacterium]MCC7399573.1 sigma-54-dependent Fis family transcriptional regulator [Planctomycetota bacterium]
MVFTARRLLLIEDDDSLRHVLSREVRRMGLEVVTHPRGDGVLELLPQADPDVVLLDLHLPGQPGIDTLVQLHGYDPTLPVVVFTGHGTVTLAVQAMQRGAFDFLTKPVALDVLEQTLRRALSHATLQRENQRLRTATAHAAAGAVVVPAESARSLELDRQVLRIGASDQSVLIHGESGSGKELVARRLHAASPRHRQPFVVVHCGAIPRQLVESELFGHVKGAFTGAEQKRTGLFEAADGGTLFLDEVGELPLELQPALLRAVQFGEIRPVGSDLVRHVDVRLLAATHRDLRRKVAEGSFREDLFYRLAVLELEVPPLRERAGDIAALAKAFLAREAQRAGRELRLDDDALRRLGQHPWPGNVRELENAIVRLGVLVDGPTISGRDVDTFVFAGQRRTSAGVLPTLSLPELEQIAIRAALQQQDGNKTKAAAVLGIALKTLYNKLSVMQEGPPETPPGT